MTAGSRSSLLHWGFSDQVHARYLLPALCFPSLAVMTGHSVTKSILPACPRPSPVSLGDSAHVWHAQQQGPSPPSLPPPSHHLSLRCDLLQLLPPATYHNIPRMLGALAGCLQLPAWQNLHWSNPQLHFKGNQTPALFSLPGGPTISPT